MKKLDYRALTARLAPYRWPALVLALGLLLLWIPGKKTEQETVVTAQTESADAFDLETFTTETERLLSTVEGAGTVRVLFSLEDGGRVDYLRDETQRQSGDSLETERKAVLVGSGSGETPVTVRTYCPAFRGAVVLASGADSDTMTLRLKEAISCLTGLGMDKITVLKQS